MRFGGTKVQIEDARQNGFVDVVFPLKDLRIIQPPRQNTLPGRNTGLRPPRPFVLKSRYAEDLNIKKIAMALWKPRPQVG